MRARSIVHGGQRRPYGGISRFHGTAAHGDRAAAELPADHPAVVEDRTLFPRSVLTAGQSPRLLISGQNSAKIGDRITKGAWRGLRVYTFSLEERATCPPSCTLLRECLVPETLVLTADLRWVPLGDLSLGDRIAAFDDEAQPGRQHRMTRIAEVEALGRATLPCYRVITDKGEVIASENHLWLRRRSRLCYKWKQTKQLKLGDKLQFFGKPWSTDRSYDAGRLRGFVEGEGYCTVRRVDGSSHTRVGWAQRPTKLCDEIIELAQGLGFRTARYERIAGVAQTAVSHIDVVGGWKEDIAFVGRIRPTRIIERSEEMWQGHDIGGRGGIYATVIAIEPVGKKRVVTIQTSTSTIVAGGFFTHNCYGNAMPFARRHTPSPDLEPRLRSEIAALLREHRRGIAIRLHVLGDFFSEDYARFWVGLVRDLPRLHVWGYTAHPADSRLGRILADANRNLAGRWSFRFSVASDAPHAPSQSSVAWAGEVPSGLLCPAQTGQTDACGTCALCWSRAMVERRIVFVGHGMRGRGKAREAA